VGSSTGLDCEEKTTLTCLCQEPKPGRLARSLSLYRLSYHVSVPALTLYSYNGYYMDRLFNYKNSTFYPETVFMFRTVLTINIMYLRKQYEFVGFCYGDGVLDLRILWRWV
jgi:hypothetical protein